MSMRLKKRCISNGQPNSATNYHHTHSGEHVSMVAERPSHPGGAPQVQQHHVFHKESFKEVDGAKAPANRRCFDNYYPMKANNAAMAAGSFHHYDSYVETYKETCEEETYGYGAGRHHGNGGGGRRVQYSHEETYEEDEEEEEFVVGGGGGCAQLRRGYRGA